jgi:hypothetical protein
VRRSAALSGPKINQGSHSFLRKNQFWLAKRPPQSHMFVGRDSCKFRARQINHLRAELPGGFWATIEEFPARSRIRLFVVAGCQAGGSSQFKLIKSHDDRSMFRTIFRKMLFRKHGPQVHCHKQRGVALRFNQRRSAAHILSGHLIRGRGVTSPSFCTAGNEGVYIT